MPFFEIVCLANSRKLAGRCVAGLRTDGAGWIRPVTPGSGELERRICVLDDESMIQVLDVVQMNLGEHAPKPFQPEDWELGGTPWKLLSRPATGETTKLIHHAVEPGSLIFGTTGDRISIAQIEESPPLGSLVLVRPESPGFYWVARNRGRQARASFGLGENQYDLAVTDPAWEERIKDLEAGTHGPESLGFAADDDIVLTVSLGEPYGGYHYKLIAAIILLPAIPRPDTAQLPEIRLSTQDFERLEALEGPYGFSCNEYLEVWRSVVHGLTPAALRHHLQQQDEILNKIVKLVVDARPMGGRFYLADDGVRLSWTHQLVARFRFR